MIKIHIHFDFTSSPAGQKKCFFSVTWFRKGIHSSLHLPLTKWWAKRGNAQKEVLCRVLQRSSRKRHFSCTIYNIAQDLHFEHNLQSRRPRALRHCGAAGSSRGRQLQLLGLVILAWVLRLSLSFCCVCVCLSLCLRGTYLHPSGESFPLCVVNTVWFRFNSCLSSSLSLYLSLVIVLTTTW